MKNIQLLNLNTKVIFIEMFVMLIMFGSIILLNRGTYSVGESSVDSLSLVCPETAVAGTEVECIVEINSVTMTVQGVSSKYRVTDGLEFVSFNLEDIWNDFVNDRDGFVIVNKNNEGITGNNLIGKIKYNIPSDAVSNNIYKIELVDVQIGDGEQSTINYDVVYDEIRILSNINTLKTLSISNGKLNETFDKDKNEYTATTNNDKINIDVIKSDEHSNVSGDIGELDVHYGTNVYNIKVTSETGNVNTYIITIYRDFELDIENYLYNKDNNYLYTGNETDNETILNNIIVPNELSKSISDNKLVIKYDNEVLKEIDIVNISSEKYDLDNEYIYLGRNKELDDSKIDVLNCKTSIEDNKLVIKYNEIIIDEYVLLSISFNDLNVDGSVIMLDDTMAYDNFINNIEVSDGIIYKIYNGNDIVTSGDVTGGMNIKIYYGDKEIDMYSISDYSLVIGSKLEVDEGNKNIISDDDEVSVTNFLNEITVTGLNVKLVVTSNSGVTKKNTDYIGTGDIFTTYVNDVKKEQYTLVIIGDTSGDGKINSLDLIQLRKHIVEYKNPNTGVIEVQTGIYKDALDISGDGNVNSLDLVRMRKRIVGLE